MSQSGSYDKSAGVFSLHPPTPTPLQNFCLHPWRPILPIPRGKINQNFLPKLRKHMKMSTMYRCNTRRGSQQIVAPQPDNSGSGSSFSCLARSGRLSSSAILSHECGFSLVPGQSLTFSTARRNKRSVLGSLFKHLFGDLKPQGVKVDA